MFRADRIRNYCFGEVQNHFTFFSFRAHSPFLFSIRDQIINLRRNNQLFAKSGYCMFRADRIGNR